MAIQFLCPSCKHPIEIDDQWAMQSVACPFCRNTVTAPAQSSFTPPPAVPEASPVGPTTHAVGGDNKIAMVALLLSCLSIVSLLAMEFVLAPRILEAVGTDATPEEMQRFVQEQIETGQPPQWLITSMLVFLLSALCWLGGLVCGIIGVTRPVRRRTAIAALGILSVAPLMMCVGLAAG